MLAHTLNASAPDYQGFLLELSRKGVEACLPARVLPACLPDLANHKGRVIVIGAGKASAAMAAALEDHYGDDAPLEGIVVTRYGYGVPTRKIKIIEAAHPVPDAAGLEASNAIVAAVENLSADDLVIALISGGGSALLALPAPGITLEEKRAINKALLSCGAPIDEMNCVRKHISAIKGGRLAMAAQPARVLGLIISDVPDNDPSVVASGPTCPDAGTQGEALEILRRYNIEVPDRVWEHLNNPENETPKPGDACFTRVETKMAARGMDALEAAAKFAQAEGFEIINMGDGVEGEARDVARAMVHQALDMAKSREKPFIILSGGETTITLKGSGSGGRNQEFALAAMMEAAGDKRIYGLAIDTDGIDGDRDIAGAVFTPESFKLAEMLKLSPQDYLDNNDSYGFFAQLPEHLINTGPTYTNVNDFRAILVVP
ncbi:MAG TPA: glycerate kinase [Alphaproteobacteria bacterium]|nr:glycerate kinase [Alphaproteobacteria bacterium]